MRNRLLAMLSACLLLFTLSACTPEPIVGIPSSSQSADAPALKVAASIPPAGVNTQEGALVAHVYAAALKAAGIKAEVQAVPATPQKMLDGLENGGADIVPGYSRELLAAVAPSHTAQTPEDVLSSLKSAVPEGIGVLAAAKSQDGENLVVTAATAEKYQLKSIADLAKVCDELLMGGSAGFQASGRGLAGLGSVYNCVPKKYVSLEPLFDGSSGDVLWALLRDDIQVANIHSSAPSIEDNSLVPLTDSKDLFLGQNIVPLVATKTVSADVQTILNKVSDGLSTEELANLNRLSQDGHFGDLSEVAAAWLVQVGLVKAGP